MTHSRNPLIAAVVLGLFAVGAVHADPPQKKNKERKEQKAEEKAQRKEQKAAKKQHHNNGKALLGDKLHGNGHHVLKQKGDVTASVDVKDGKVAGFHAKHAKKGDLPVKKYKTTKKMAMVRPAPVAVASLDPMEMQGGITVTIYIGYAYDDPDYPDDEEIYWFPADEVWDGDAGAVDYYDAGY